MFGIDTFVPVTQERLDVARRRLGMTPLFWARYFKRPGFAEDFQPRTEAKILRDNRIRLLPIARQTRNVAGTAALGAADAVQNVEAFVEAMGEEHLASVRTELLMFLDVEGTGADHPNLSVDYYIGWSASLMRHSRQISDGRFTIQPAVYCRQNQPTTWRALIEAQRLGFPCEGGWVFRMRSGACTRPSPDWDPAFLMPADPLPFPVMIWQYAIDCDEIDYDWINPDLEVEESLLGRLAIPAAP